MAFQNFKLQLQTILVVARNISRFVSRYTARILSRFSQNETRNISRFFPCAKFFSHKSRHLLCVVDSSIGKALAFRPERSQYESCSVLEFIISYLQNINLEMFLAIGRKLNFEIFRDIPLCPCGTSKCSSEIDEAFITVNTKQGWEFAHWFSEQIARFLRKNERMSDLLKKTSDSTSLITKEGMSESLIF